MNIHTTLRMLMALILLGITVMTLSQTIIPLWEGYTAAYYTDDIYKGLREAYDGSQYRQKERAGLIPDETVFSYAAGAYARGVDPILINSEHTPLGKYLIGLFIVLMKNDKFIVLPSAILALLGVWIIGWMTIRDKVAALVPVVILSTEPLFLNQIRTAPLLDIIQLPWILFAIAAFLHEQQSGKFFFTAVMIGVTMATKTVVPGLLLVATFFSYLAIRGQWNHVLKLMLWLGISVGIFIVSYARTFISGYSIADFIGFQKWIFLYQKSKLIFPFSVWRLLFFNQWQAWWGDMSIIRADDWRWTWPVSTLLGFVSMSMVAARKVASSEPVVVLILWVIIYSAFLSIGVVSSRFFLPLFPVSYIVSVWALRWGIGRLW